MVFFPPCLSVTIGTAIITRFIERDSKTFHKNYFHKQYWFISSASLRCIMIIILRKKQADPTLGNYSIINSKSNLWVPFLIKLQRKLGRKFLVYFILCQISPKPFKHLVAMLPQSFQKMVIQLQKTVSPFFAAAEETQQYWVSCIDISFQNFKIYFLDPFLKSQKQVGMVATIYKLVSAILEYAKTN